MLPFMKSGIQGMQYAQQYLVDHNRPAYLPISRVLEGGENQGKKGGFCGINT